MGLLANATLSYCYRGHLAPRYRRHFPLAAHAYKLKVKGDILPMRRLGTLMVAAALAAGLFTWTNRAQAEGHAGRRAVDKVAAVYPELAQRNRIRGVVKVEVVVRENGSVKSAKVLGGSPLLVDSAADAVRKWKFEPASQETAEVVQVQFGD